MTTQEGEFIWWIRTGLPWRLLDTATLGHFLPYGATEGLLNVISVDWGKATEEPVTDSRGRRPFAARHGSFPGLAALQTQKLHPHHQLQNPSIGLSQMNSSCDCPQSLLLLASTRSPHIKYHSPIMPYIIEALLFVFNLAISASPPILCFEKVIHLSSLFTFPVSLMVLQSFISSPLSQVFASWRVLSDSDLAPAQPVHSSSPLPLLPWPVLPWALTAESLKLRRAYRGLYQAIALGCLQFLSWHCICAERIFHRKLSVLPPASFPKLQYLI